jgi:autotransporter translocation and assembly factor TamB
VKRDSSGNVTADQLDLLSGPLSASGSGSFIDGQIAADLKGALADISTLAKDATGAISLAVTAKGSPLAPDVAATLNSDKLVVANREITGLKLSAAGKADAANPAAEVTLAADVAGQALQGKAVLKTTDGRREINGLTLSLGKNQIAGDLVLDDAFLPEGKISFELPDIGPLAALALEKAEGEVRGTVAFTKPGGIPQVDVKASTAGITRGDLSAKGVTIDALIANYAAAPAMATGRHSPAAQPSRTFRPKPRAVSRSPAAQPPSSLRRETRRSGASKPALPRLPPLRLPTARRRSKRSCSPSAVARPPSRARSATHSRSTRHLPACRLRSPTISLPASMLPVRSRARSR